MTYKQAAAKVNSEHSDNSEDHYCFADQVLKFLYEHRPSFSAWAAAARIILAFTASSGRAKRVFSLINNMFGDKQKVPSWVIMCKLRVCFEDHSFADQVLKIFYEHSTSFPAGAAAARTILAFTATHSAGAMRVFSHANNMFGEKQKGALMDHVQAACMLRNNKRQVGQDAMPMRLITIFV